MTTCYLLTFCLITPSWAQDSGIDTGSDAEQVDSGSASADTGQSSSEDSDGEEESGDQEESETVESGDSDTGQETFVDGQSAAELAGETGGCQGLGSEAILLLLGLGALRGRSQREAGAPR